MSAAPNFLDVLNQRRAKLPEVEEEPASPSHLVALSEERIQSLQDLAQQAYLTADGNPCNGKWGAIPRLLRLGVTTGRKGRWLGARADLNPPELRPGMEYINASTEVEWDQWEKELGVKQRVEYWQKGVVPPSTAAETGDSVEISYVDSPAQKEPSQPSKSSVNKAPSRDASNILKDKAPFGFAVVKRTKHAVGKPSTQASAQPPPAPAVSEKDGQETQPEESAWQMSKPPSSRGNLASIADIPEIYSIPPPSFHSIDIYTSTPRAHLGESDQAKPPSQVHDALAGGPEKQITDLLDLQLPEIPPFPPSSPQTPRLTHLNDKPSSSNRNDSTPTRFQETSTPKGKSKVADQTTPLRSAWTLPIPAPPFAHLHTPTHSLLVSHRVLVSPSYPTRRSEKLVGTEHPDTLNPHGKRARPLDPTTPPSITTTHNKSIGAGELQSPKSKKARLDMEDGRADSTTKSPAVGPRSPPTPTNRASRIRPLNSPNSSSALPTLTDLLASAKRGKDKGRQLKPKGDGSPKAKSAKESEKPLVPITSIFNRSAKPTSVGPAAYPPTEPPIEPATGDHTLPGITVLSSPTRLDDTNVPEGDEGEANPNSFRDPYALNLDDLGPIDLASPTKSLSSIADSDSELESDFGEDAEHPDAIDADEVDELAADGEGNSDSGSVGPDRRKAPGKPKKNGSSSLSTSSPFKFQPFATSTQKEDGHGSSSSPFRHTPGSELRKERTEKDGVKRKAAHPPPPSSSAVPVYNSQSAYRVNIAKKVADVHRLLDRDLELVLPSRSKGGASAGRHVRDSDDDDSGDELDIEKEMSGWVRGASLDDELDSS